MSSDDIPPGSDADELVQDEPALRLRPWSAFAFVDYRFLWLSGLFILITTNLRLLSSTVWLFDQTGSAAVLGLIGGVQLVVQIPALLYGGTLADRVNRKRLMSGMQASTLVVAAFIALLAVTGLLRPWHIFLSVGLTSITAVVGEPARSALMQSVVPRSHIMHAVTSNSLTFQVAAIASPLVFAGVVATFGITPAFVMVAFTAIPGVILPWFIRASGQPQNDAPRRSVPHEIIDGFRFVKRHPILPGLVALDSSITVFSYYREILPAIARGLYAGGPAAVGVLSAANSVGAAVGSFLVLFLVGFRRKGMLVVFASVFYAAVLIPFGIVPWLAGGIVLIAALGAADAVGMTVRATTVQLTTPDQMLGRALSFFSVSAYTANNLGTLWVGLVAASVGAANTMLIGGVLAFISIYLTWRMVPGLRTYSYP